MDPFLVLSLVCLKLQQLSTSSTATPPLGHFPLKHPINKSSRQETPNSVNKPSILFRKKTRIWCSYPHRQTCELRLGGENRSCSGADPIFGCRVEQICCFNPWENLNGKKFASFLFRAVCVFFSRNFKDTGSRVGTQFQGRFFEPYPPWN